MAAFARLQQLGDQAGPAGLVRGPDAAAIIAVKIFVEQDVVLEMRVGREFVMIFQGGPQAVVAFQK